MTKLLNRSLKFFIGYAAIVLACSIPAYYLIVDRIWQQELKEHNRILANSIKQNILSLQLSAKNLEKGLALWSQLQPEMDLVRANSFRPDSTYNSYKINRYKTSGKIKEDRFQGLVTYLDLHGQPYKLTLETNMEESHETILALTLVSVIFFIILLVGLVLLNRRLSARIWRPFYQSLQKIQSFQLNSQQAPVFEPTDIAEFSTLNTGLNKLISGNLATYSQQKQFTENAAHELQTPLAIVQSKLDVFLQDASLTGKQSAHIEQAQIALSRVNHINKNLLLLARIDNLQFPEKEQVDLSALLQTNLELMDAFIDEQQLQLSTAIAPGVTLHANKALTEVLSSNLLMNAIRHSTHKGTIELSLTNEIFRIANTGTTPLQKDQLFKRFGRAASLTPATGLGLAIAHQVCTLYGWDISYHFEEQQHVFTVRFS